jgi:hypothetical protein
MSQAHLKRARSATGGLFYFHGPPPATTKSASRTPHSVQRNSRAQSRTSVPEPLLREHQLRFLNGWRLTARPWTTSKPAAQPHRSASFCSFRRRPVRAQRVPDHEHYDRRFEMKLLRSRLRCACEFARRTKAHFERQPGRIVPPSDPAVYVYAAPFGHDWRGALKSRQRGSARGIQR